MPYGLIRLRKDREYSDEERNEARSFNRKLVECVFPELTDFFTTLEATPRNVQIKVLPEPLSSQYKELMRRFS